MTARNRLQQARPGGFRGFEANDAAGAALPVPHPCAFSRPRAGSAIRFVLSTLLATSMFVAARTAYADDSSQLELGKTRFASGEYEQAAERFAAMLDPSQAPCDSGSKDVTSACRLTDPDVIERARAYYAASLIALERVDEADAQIFAILSQNLQFSPDPAVFPQKVVDRFTFVRARRREELDGADEIRRQQESERQQAAERVKQAEKRWLDAVVKQASEEQVVVTNSRFVAALPFGIGQFQNGSRSLGWAFAISQAVLGSTSIITKQMFTYYRGFDQRIANGAERELLYNNQVISLRINQATFAAFSALAIAGIVQAQVAFVPQKLVVNKRPVPARPAITSLQLSPTLSPNMFGVGISGAF